MLNSVDHKLIKAIISQLEKVANVLQEIGVRSASHTLTENRDLLLIRIALEHFNALKKGMDTGMVNYEERKTDLRLENEPDYTLAYIYALTLWLQGLKDNLTFSIKYTINGHDHSVVTNLERELLYNYSKLQF